MTTARKLSRAKLERDMAIGRGMTVKSPSNINADDPYLIPSTRIPARFDPMAIGQFLECAASVHKQKSRLGEICLATVPNGVVKSPYCGRNSPPPSMAER
jgi:hypothetical protein